MRTKTKNCDYSSILKLFNKIIEFNNIPTHRVNNFNIVVE